ncbi:hypothetical protein IscW_ISCW017228 [Ixodes scapularis]|uniref:Secreted protein n=1 Tax=Ixodes scapularis TaxID=6945 RepID=B7PCQ3_IXOSC|nr:hypothetical protein IscW_ISCW017228 [Ixodes scapularis]|eukprot:XP_002410112.1 hypothetical protein IscW_ISCW017228 [Ixodes scapularis]
MSGGQVTSPMSTTLVLVLLAAVAAVVGFPQGGPAESCDSMLPRHVYTQPKPAHESPYTFVASASRYSFQNVDGIQAESLLIGHAKQTSFISSNIPVCGGKEKPTTGIQYAWDTVTFSDDAQSCRT